MCFFFFCVCVFGVFIFTHTCRDDQSHGTQVRSGHGSSEYGHAKDCTKKKVSVKKRKKEMEKMKVVSMSIRPSVSCVWKEQLASNEERKKREKKEEKKKEKKRKGKENTDLPIDINWLVKFQTNN